MNFNFLFYSCDNSCRIYMYLISVWQEYHTVTDLDLGLHQHLQSLFFLITFNHFFSNQEALDLLWHAISVGAVGPCNWHGPTQFVPHCAPREACGLLATVSQVNRKAALNLPKTFPIRCFLSRFGSRKCSAFIKSGWHGHTETACLNDPMKTEQCLIPRN